MTERRWVAALSLAAAYLFFLEYLPPFKQVHLPYDLEGYHYPLLNYAFKTIREAQIPEWDPSIYCGLSFVGNVQAALFYPPNWLLFAVNLGRGGLAYKSVEILVIAHVWLAFWLAYRWLRAKPLGAPASVLGAGVFAYSGYMMSQIQHMGVVTGYAWFPLGLWSIDQAAREGRMRPLWKLAAASALCFLAGYPPAWFVFCVCAAVYALAAAPIRTLPAVTGALAFSVLLVMVQALPALEAAALKTPEKKYGGGIKGAEFAIFYFLPNYYNLAPEAESRGEPTGEYFYLGAPALFGLAAFPFGRKRRAALPALAIAAVSLAMMTNPGNLVEPMLERVPFLEEICRDWSFLAGMSLAAALLAATALDGFWNRGRIRIPGWLAPLMIASTGLWCARQIWVSLPGGAEFASGWRSMMDPAVALALFTLGAFALRAEGDPRRRSVLTAALLAGVFVDYKVFGTNRRFNATGGDADRFFADARTTGRAEFAGMDDAVYRHMLAHPEFRVAVDERGPHATDLRHYGLATPQGFDPFLPAQYKKRIDSYGAFRTDRLFDVDPAKRAMMEQLGVRFYITVSPAASYQTLKKDPDFRLLEPSESYFRVFEYRKAKPAYRWAGDDGSADCVKWEAQRREFVVRSRSGGRLALIEQFFPGWTATVDGRDAPVERWDEAFQSVSVGPGEHRVAFRYRSPGLRVGAVVSAAALAGLWGFLRRR